MEQTAEKNRMPINFQQHLYDSPERFWQFHAGQGNFLQMLINRFQWYEYPRHFFVGDFPLHVDIETTSRCNMNCPMCYRDQLKQTGDMNLEVFKSIIDQCCDNGLYSVRLSWRGEPLLHPKIFDMVSYAAQRIPNVSFLTNTYFLSNKNADMLIKAGLTYIACSFDGIGQIYEAIRKPAKYRQSLDKLRYLKKTRDSLGKTKPQIRVTTIWPAISKDPQAYYDALNSVTDMIVVNDYQDFAAAPQPLEDFICQYPWQRLMIAFDGTVQCCVGLNNEESALGNIRQSSLKQLWHCEKIRKFRLMQRKGRRLKSAGCRTCPNGCEKPDQSIDIYEIIKRGH